MIRIAGADVGRFGARRRCIPASDGVRPPFLRLQETQQLTMFSQFHGRPGRPEYMIEGQLARGKPSPQIGTDGRRERRYRPRERDVVEPALDLDVAKQADDRRQLEADGNGPISVAQITSTFPAPKGDGLLPVDNLERLMTR